MSTKNAFTQMVDDARVFFRELEADNTKAWFDANRDRYKTQIKAPAEMFISLMAEELSKMTGRAHKGKLFRANRDVRFSKDKRPYNTHLHMSWSDAATEGVPSFFWGASNDYVIAGYGLMGLQGPELSNFRALVDKKGDALTAAMAGAGASLSDYGPEPLKRVPKPYDPGHPHGDLLRRKSFTIVQDLAAAMQLTDADAFELSRAAFERYLPVHEIMTT